jgi:putative ABC transport system permease protein
MVGMAMDLRVAVRSLPRRPAFAAVSIVTLALGVGAATLLFSVVNGVLLSPLPYERPDELVTVYGTIDEWHDSDNELLRNAWDVQMVRLDHIEAWRAGAGPIAAVSGYMYRNLPLRVGSGPAEQVDVISVERAAFAVLGVRAEIGRLPDDADFRMSRPVAVLRHETWTRLFGGDPEVLGRSFDLGDDTYTVIGVMPAGFFFPTEDGGDLWTPPSIEERAWPSFYGIARLAPGATVADASAFLERVARRLGEDQPGLSGFGARAVPHLDNVVGRVRGGIQLLFGTALLVVLVACANLGNLFLARASGRQEELAVRASLGAGTGSLASAMLAEVVFIGGVGGLLGVGSAAGLIDPFVAALGASVRGLPRQGGIGLDLAVLGFSLAATLATTLVAALVPVLITARRGPAALTGGVRRSGTRDATRRSQRALLALQATLTVTLVAAAVLLGRSFMAVMSVDVGMDTQRVAVLELGADRERFESPRALMRVQEAVQSRLDRLPGVSSASLTTSLPGTGGVLLLRVRPEDSGPEAIASVLTVATGGGYFSTVGVPLLAGRDLRPEDGGSTVRNAVISESLAVQLFGQAEVVGRRLLDGGGEDPVPIEIVGVVGEARQLSLFQEAAPTLYYPLGDRPTKDVYVILATDGEPAAVLGNARAAALAVDGRLVVERTSTLDAILRDSARHVRLRSVLMSSLAGLAVLLAMIGISGVVAHFLSEQARDVGIRMALGAEARREVSRVVGHALAPTAVGLALGVAIAVAGSRVMKSFLFGIEPTDPTTYALTAGMLLGAAALAAWIPARRTAAIDPVRVLNRDA